jgi:hypothetical protein
MHLSNEESSSLAIHQRGPLLEQAKQFKDNYDNDNYSDYIENASVHADDRYQRGCALASFYLNILLRMFSDRALSAGNVSPAQAIRMQSGTRIF